ncbi:MAG: LPD29 domain-containing protein, partial [Cyanobacteria bacterium J06626_23]
MDELTHDITREQLAQHFDGILGGSIVGIFGYRDSEHNGTPHIALLLDCKGVMITAVSSDWLALYPGRQLGLTDPKNVLQQPEQTPSLRALVQATHSIRRSLQEVFPAVRFNLSSSSQASQGNVVAIKWTDGPSEKDVECAVSQHEVINGTPDDLYLDLFRQQTVAADVAAQLDVLASVISQAANPDLLVQAGITPQTSHREIASQLLDHFGTDRLVAALT